MKRRKKTVFIVAGAALVLIVIVLLNLKHSESGQGVTTQKAGYGSILSQISATGELRAEKQVNLQAQILGVVDRLLVQEGDTVEQGQLLLELDPRAYAAQLAQARSREAQALASFARVESLYGTKLISAEQYEASRTAYETAKAQLDAAQDSYDKTVLRAPIAGTVLQVNVKQGETVILGTMNNPGTVIMVLADMSRMEARIEVDETDVVSLAIGQEAGVQVDALPDTTLAGTVTKIGFMPVQNLLSVETEGTDFEVIVSLGATVPTLRPGMTVAVDITTASLDSVLTVPIQAVGHREVDGEQTETVFVVEEGKAVLKTIMTGKSSDTDTQVLDGLNPGEEVITGPYKVLSKLKEGRRVSPGKSSSSPTFPKEKKDEEDETEP